MTNLEIQFRSLLDVVVRQLAEKFGENYPKTNPALLGQALAVAGQLLQREEVC